MKILGYHYRIIENSEYGAQLGEMNPTQQTIKVQANQCQQQKESTVLHEIIEALNFHLKLELGQDNKIIAPLEAGLYTALTDAGVDLSPLTRELKPTT